MRKLFFIFSFLITLASHAQTTKTDVLVIGYKNAALAAGVQAAVSNVNTTILTQHNGFMVKELNEFAEGGLKTILETKIRKTLKLADSITLPKYDQQMLNVWLKGWADTAKLFHIINNSAYEEIRRSGNGWEVRLNNNQSIKAKVLIVADEIDKILPVLKRTNLAPATQSILNYEENLYRTSVAGIGGSVLFQPLSQLLIPGQENLLYIDTEVVETGQAAGATAAYAAFFQTKTSSVKLKAIQGELLHFKLPLIPFDDIKPSDSNWLAIQKTGLTGILKAEKKDGKLIFHPEKPLTEGEIKPTIKLYYPKAQIWFDDHPGLTVNLENTLSMICYVGNRDPESTKRDLEKNWKKGYRFTTPFDLKKVLSRREFAVIINNYLAPFDKVNVDLTGRVIQ